MSFILDALRKSENERQEQSSAEFSSVPSSSSNPSPARWLWMLGGLLFINFAVLIYILMKPTPAANAIKLEPAASSESRSRFEEQVAVAVDDQPVQAPAATEQRNSQAREPATAAPVPAKPVVARTSNTSLAVVPTIDELRLDGSLQIAELHLDIHVFSETPADRFVFINMNKHREGSKISEGPVVREIRPDGVVLEHQGRVFLLPRE